MKIIISPAKKMEVCGDYFPTGTLPDFLDRSEILYEKLKTMAEPELKELFCANDRITHENFLRYQTMDLHRALTPALLSYVGIQYQYMAPKLFSWSQWDYVREHLRILSGFYGVLRPDDRVTPYRLEMQAKLPVDGRKDLYEFWGDRLYRKLEEEEEVEGNGVQNVQDKELEKCKNQIRQCRKPGKNGVILNLASKEYSRAVEPYLEPGMRFVTCVFGTLTEGRVKVKATEAKMARGEMVRWMAENRIRDVEKIREFRELEYRFAEEFSGKDMFVYVKVPRA